MKIIRLFLLLTLLLTSVGNLSADVVVEGEQDVYIELLNAKDFPDYKFYIQYQDYYYDQGHHAGKVSVVYLEPGKHHATGDRGSSSLLYAEGGKDDLYESTSRVGGTGMERNNAVAYLLDRIKVTRVGENGVEFKVVERQLIGENGKVIKTIKNPSIQKGEIGPLDQGAFLMWLLPIVCMVGLVVFFLLRRKVERIA
jgi:hypothetical protein